MWKLMRVLALALSLVVAGSACDSGNDDDAKDAGTEAAADDDGGGDDGGGNDGGGESATSGDGESDEGDTADGGVGSGEDGQGDSGNGFPGATEKLGVGAEENPSAIEVPNPCEVLTAASPELEPRTGGLAVDAEPDENPQDDYVDGEGQYQSRSCGGTGDKFSVRMVLQPAPIGILFGDEEEVEGVGDAAFIGTTAGDDPEFFFRVGDVVGWVTVSGADFESPTPAKGDVAAIGTGIVAAMT